MGLSERATPTSNAQHRHPSIAPSHIPRSHVQGGLAGASVLACRCGDEPFPAMPARSGQMPRGARPPGDCHPVHSEEPVSGARGVFAVSGGRGHLHVLLGRQTSLACRDNCRSDQNPSQSFFAARLLLGRPVRCRENGSSGQIPTVPPSFAAGHLFSISSSGTFSFSTPALQTTCPTPAQEQRLETYI